MCQGKSGWDTQHHPVEISILVGRVLKNWFANSQVKECRDLAGTLKLFSDDLKELQTWNFESWETVFFFVNI